MPRTGFLRVLYHLSTAKAKATALCCPRAQNNILKMSKIGKSCQKMVCPKCVKLNCSLSLFSVYDSYLSKRNAQKQYKCFQLTRVFWACIHLHWSNCISSFGDWAFIHSRRRLFLDGKIDHESSRCWPRSEDDSRMEQVEQVFRKQDGTNVDYLITDIPVCFLCQSFVTSRRCLRRPQMFGLNCRREEFPGT